MKIIINLWEWFHGLIIFLISILLIGSCLFLTVNAYITNLLINNKIFVLQQETYQLLLEKNLPVIDQVKMECKLKEIQSASKGVLDSNSISFLFQMLAILLLSAGIFLLTKTHKDYLKIKDDAAKVIERIANVPPLIGKTQTNYLLLCQTVRAGFLAQMLSAYPESTEVMRNIQDVAKSFKERIRKISTNNIMDKETFGFLLDELGFVIVNLKTMDQEFADPTLIQQFDEITSVLKLNKHTMIKEYDDLIEKLKKL